MTTEARSAVNAVLTPGRLGRRPRVVENAEFTAFGSRVLRAAGAGSLPVTLRPCPPSSHCRLSWTT